jgi:PAS domain S-box-containing protein
MSLRPSSDPDLRASRRWRWTFFVAIVLLVVSGALAVQQYFRFSAASRRVDHTYEVLSTIDELVMRSLDAETGARGFLLTRDASFLDPYAEGAPRVRAAAAKLVSIVDDNPEQRTRALRLRDLSQQRLDELRYALSDARAGRRNEAMERMTSGVGNRYMDDIRTLARDMKAAESSLLDQRAYEATVARRALAGFAAASFVIAIALGLLAVAVHRGFERRRAAYEREIAGRLLAERSMLTTSEELQRIESVNRSILDNSGDCIQVFEPDGRLISMNRTGVRLMEIEDVEQFMARRWFECWYESGSLAHDAIAAAVATGEGRFQAFSPTAKGTPRWWDVIVTPIRDGTGHVAKLLSISRDISAQKHAEDERSQLLASERAARSEAERATHMKDEFLATLSHELRTPLNSIVGWVGVLKQDQGPDTLRKALEVIDRNSRRQVQMIDDLLDVSRIDSGKLPLDLQRIDLVSIIEEAVLSVQPTADAKGVSLVTTLGAPAFVRGDAGRLQQVVWNLVSNAIKFTNRDGMVNVSLRSTGTHAHIDVSDTGQGIAPDLLPQIFQRFRQGDSSLTRRYGGLGLGLAIVKNLIEMHAGSVSASSDGPDNGSVFTVVLPLAPVGEAGEKSTADNPVPSAPLLANVTVMVVDDELDARELVQRLLEDAGATVSACSTAQSALRTIEAGLVPDVIVSDVGMPDQDGYDFMKQIRGMGAPISLVPAAALTALARVADRRRALMAGYQTHLAKPVDPTELVATVATLAGRTGHTTV